ncbi:MAG TPA: CRISPR-associated helicase Cas3', partial [Saprospiraceae bacterium]|nr:CRISPR-associated helicase Cas3' [Saprospiraceae bacterium]
MIEIISHPGKPLVNHLREVALRCANIIRQENFGIEIDKQVLVDLAYIMGAVHDIGKATANFQTYIHSGGQQIVRPKHHALISAFVAQEIAYKLVKKSASSSIDKQLLPYFIFTSVKRHHGNILNFSDELEKIRSKEGDLKILTQNFYDAEVQAILDDLLEPIGISYQWAGFKRVMRNLDKVFDRFSDFSIDVIGEEFGELSDELKAQYFYLHQTFFSTLLLSDKTDVILGKQYSHSADFDFNAIESYRKKKGWNIPSDKEINNLKNKSYNEGINNLKHIFRKDQHLYSITLPTGLGKTITSLAIAMELNKMLADQKPKIIITIPFTSIIDQNYQVFEDIFKSPSSNILLKHHHLAEPKYKMDDDEVKNSSESKFLIETWQSEIVVTTFVQLLEGIFTNKKGKLLKFPNLINSIIILDEIQQIKFELWELIRTAFRVLAEKYNCYFILMSATQPLIFAPNKEIQEIIPNFQQYFKFFKRTKLINRTSQVISLADFSEKVVNYHHQNPKKDLLIILNTKAATLTCFKAVTENIPPEKANLYFLSTYITPYERKIIIEKIKNKNNDLPNIIISTQLIEAGVDISVNTVFRAMAPLDSIIQAAGRANRYWENPEPSHVFLYRIEELERATNMIYGSVLLNKTQNVLRDIDT